MTIYYANGTTIQAALLSRDGDTIRVAPQSGEDVVAFVKRGDLWVSEDCEPVRIEFEWERLDRSPCSDEADFICSPQLASQLLYLLFSGEEPEAESARPSEEPSSLTATAVC